MKFSAVTIFFAIVLSCLPALSHEELINNTLICQEFKAKYNHGRIPDRDDFRTVVHIYFTSKNMFVQSAIKDMTLNKVLSSSSGGNLGYLFEWDQIHEGTAGLSMKFTSYASLSSSGVGYEIETITRNVFSDDITLTRFERGDIYLAESKWTMFQEAKQTIPGGRRAAIYNSESWFHCTLHSGRYLLK
jgi:hypothetical protein